jgi:hypothetical protein
METKSKEPKVKRILSTEKNGKRLRIRREPNNIAEEIIRKRAYEIYLERGTNSGNEIDDWKKAENEIKLSAKKNKYIEKDFM